MNFFLARKTAEKNIDLERVYKSEAWGVYQMGVESYDKNFSDLLGKSLIEYVEEKQKSLI